NYSINMRSILRNDSWIESSDTRGCGHQPPADSRNRSCRNLEIFKFPDSIIVVIWHFSVGLITCPRDEVRRQGLEIKLSPVLVAAHCGIGLLEKWVSNTKMRPLQNDIFP